MYVRKKIVLTWPYLRWSFFVHQSIFRTTFLSFNTLWRIQKNKVKKKAKLGVLSMENFTETLMCS